MNKHDVPLKFPAPTILNSEIEKKRKTTYNREKLLKLATVLDRYKISSSAGATIALATITDFGSVTSHNIIELNADDLVPTTVLKDAFDIIGFIIFVLE